MEGCDPMKSILDDATLLWRRVGLFSIRINLLVLLYTLLWANSTPNIHEKLEEFTGFPKMDTRPRQVSPCHNLTIRPADGLRDGLIYFKSKMQLLSLFIRSEIFQGITADQPGESGAYQGEYPFENGHHAGLLNAVKAAVRGRWKRILLLLT